MPRFGQVPTAAGVSATAKTGELADRQKQVHGASPGPEKRQRKNHRKLAAAISPATRRLKHEEMHLWSVPAVGHSAAGWAALVPRGQAGGGCGGNGGYGNRGKRRESTKLPCMREGFKVNETGHRYKRV